MPADRLRSGWPSGEGSTTCPILRLCLGCTSSRTLTGVLEWAADLQVTGVAGLGKRRDSRGKMALGGARKVLGGMINEYFHAGAADPTRPGYSCTPRPVGKALPASAVRHYDHLCPCACSIIFISSLPGSAAGWSCSAGHRPPRTPSSWCCGTRSPGAAPHQSPAPAGLGDRAVLAALIWLGLPRPCG